LKALAYELSILSAGGLAWLKALAYDDQHLSADGLAWLKAFSLFGLLSRMI